MCKTGTFDSSVEKESSWKAVPWEFLLSPAHSPSLSRAGRGGSKDAVGPWRSPLTVVYLCNKWNIHRGAAVTARLHKSRGTQRAFQTSLCTWLTSVTRTTKLGLGPVDIQITSTIVQLFLEHHWWQQRMHQHRGKKRMFKACLKLTWSSINSKCPRSRGGNITFKTHQVLKHLLLESFKKHLHYCQQPKVKIFFEVLCT